MLRYFMFDTTVFNSLLDGKISIAPFPTLRPLDFAPDMPSILNIVFDVRLSAGAAFNTRIIAPVLAPALRQNRKLPLQRLNISCPYIASYQLSAQ